MDRAPASGAGCTGSTPVRRKAKPMHKKIVSVIGGHKCSLEVGESAFNLGRKLAKVVDILICGGLSGVMEAVCRGFKAENGLTIGITASYDKEAANDYVDVVIPSGLGFARNVLVVKSADVVVALPGEEGTLSEVAFALQFKIPVISLNSWDIKGVIKVSSVEEAIKEVKKIIGK